MLSSNVVAIILAYTAALTAGSPTERNLNNARRNVEDYGVQDAADTVERSVEDYGVQDVPGARVFRRGDFEIVDYGVRDVLDEDEEETDTDLEERKTTDGISSCGDNWMPVDDQSWGSGYKSAVAEYCYHITHAFDNKPTVIGAKQKHAALVKGGYTLKGDVPAAVDFEVHNKMKDGDHTPSESFCNTYLMKMAQSGQKCYGKKNKDTKGGTWQIGKEKISYHGLPKSQHS